MKKIYQLINFHKIKELTPPILWKMLKRFKFKQKHYGLNDLDKKMEKYLNYKDGYFVEAGANNGINQSNTLFYEENKIGKAF